MAVPYLVITDGTTTCTIITSSATVGDYALDEERGGWTPAIAGLRKSQIGGGGPYEDVIETMYLTIIDTTAAACYTRLQTLNNLLEQAERWYMGENQTAVLVKYCPPGATVSTSASPLQAAVLGRAPGNQTSGVGLVPTWDEAGFTFQLKIVLSFYRRGQWLHTTTANTSASTANGTVVSTSLTSALSIPGPTQCDIDNMPTTAGTDEGFFIVSSNDGQTRLLSVDVSAATAANWTTVNDSANYAQYTSVLRYTPVATTESNSATITAVTASASDTSETGLVTVFANIRNNSATTSFLVRAYVFANGSFKYIYTPYVYIAPIASAAPYWVNLGTVPLADTSGFALYCTASAASGTIDFGAVVLVDSLYAHTYILSYKPSQNTASTMSMQIDHSLLAHPRSRSTGSGYAFDVRGDKSIHTLAQNIACVNLITRPGANDWRQTTSVPAVVNNTFTLTRYSAYTTPK